MIEFCSWCDRPIFGELVAPGIQYLGEFGSGEKPEILKANVGFCCNGCAWAWWIESHRLFGVTGNEAREHLIKEHGLVHPPGVAGKQSVHCFREFEKRRLLMYDFISPEMNGDVENN